MIEEFEEMEPPSSVPVRSWANGVPFEEAARQQVRNIASLPFVGPHVAVMPDVHFGRGATVGSVIPTSKAIIPAAVGVDIGCGMMATRLSLTADQLPDKLSRVRNVIERTVPTGFADWKRQGGRKSKLGPPAEVEKAWLPLERGYRAIADQHPHIAQAKTVQQLGTLGGGNHFIELCIDEAERVWVMLHSGSRGVGNRIGQYFIEMAKKDVERNNVHLPDVDLAYFEEGSEHFAQYVQAVDWAQGFARQNREVMMARVLFALRETIGLAFTTDEAAVNCHHNYVQRERHFGQEVWLTRKGAVSARQGQLGIIPGSMGARSYIVRGKGCADSFHSCAHGAGRAMSRSKARKHFTQEDHIRATEGVACRKDKGVLDETPGAYKSIDAVMAAQTDLVDVVHRLKQVVCVKG